MRICTKNRSLFILFVIPVLLFTYLFVYSLSCFLCLWNVVGLCICIEGNVQMRRWNKGTIDLVQTKRPNEELGEKKKDNRGRKFVIIRQRRKENRNPIFLSQVMFLQFCVENTMFPSDKRKIKRLGCYSWTQLATMAQVCIQLYKLLLRGQTIASHHDIVVMKRT